MPAGAPVRPGGVKQPLVLRIGDLSALAPTGVQRLLGTLMPEAAARKLAGRYTMSSRERDFVRRVLEHKTNVHLWRCHQGSACGDFLLIDMAAGPVDRRSAVVVELKAGAELRLGGNDHQLRNAEDAVAELIAAGALAATAGLTRVSGDKDVVLAWLSA